MGEGIKFAIGAAFFGIFLGIAGLVFGIVSKNRAEQIQKELSQVNELFGKIQRIEESSDGMSASAIRLARDLDALKEGTQNVLTQVNQEINRLRRDLNEEIGKVRGLETQLREVANRPAAEPPPPATSPQPTATVPDEAPADRDEVSPSAEEVERIYVVQANDTLTRIAARHGVSLDALMEANPDVDPIRMQIGQRLRIPNN